MCRSGEGKRQQMRLGRGRHFLLLCLSPSPSVGALVSDNSKGKSECYWVRATLCLWLSASPRVQILQHTPSVRLCRGSFPLEAFCSSSQPFERCWIGRGAACYCAPQSQCSDVPSERGVRSSSHESAFGSCFFSQAAFLKACWSTEHTNLSARPHSGHTLKQTSHSLGNILARERSCYSALCCTHRGPQFYFASNPVICREDADSTAPVEHLTVHWAVTSLYKMYESLLLPPLLSAASLQGRMLTILPLSGGS